MATHRTSQVIEQLRRMLLQDDAALSDGQLLGYFVEHHDEAAFTALVKRHGALVWGVCRRLLNVQDAEDAFQATFLVLCRKAASIKKRETVARWLHGVAHQTALQARRTAARRRAREKQVVELPERAVMEQNPGDEWQPLLDQELRRLPSHYQEVILLCDLEGKNRKEVAELLGLPEGTVGSRLARARALLAKRLARHGLAVTEETLGATLPPIGASATVPAALAARAIQNAASSSAAAGMISDTVAALTESVMKAMLLAKLKNVLGACLVLGFLMLGSVFGYHLLAGTADRKTEHRAANQPNHRDALLPQRALARLGSDRLYHGPIITCAVLSPDGQRIASAAHYFDQNISAKEHFAFDPLIVIWDAATGKRLRELRTPFSYFTRLAFSPDGKQIAASGTDASKRKMGIGVLNVATGKLLWHHADFESLIDYLQFSQDGRQLRGSEYQGPVVVWDAATGKKLRQLTPPTETPPGDKDEVPGVRGVLSPDGKVIVWQMGSYHEADPMLSIGLRVQDAKTDRLLYRRQFNALGPLESESFSFTADGKSFAVASFGKLILWETATGKERLSLKVPEMWGFTLTPDGRHALIHESAQGRIEFRMRWWDLLSGKPVRTLYPSYTSLEQTFLKSPQVFSADGKSLLLATASTLRLFDTVTGQERGPVGHRAPVTPWFSADGRTLFTSCDERRCRWNVTPGKEPRLLSSELRKNWETRRRGESPDGHFILAESAKHERQVRDTATGRVVCTLGDNGEEGWFSPDGSRV